MARYTQSGFFFLELTLLNLIRLIIHSRQWIRLFSIGEQFHKALKQLGFIEEIDLDNISIEISGSTQGQGHLQRIFITDLETISSIKEIWKINFEQDIEGISTKSRTTEVALLILQAYQSIYRLNVVLIELVIASEKA